MGEWRIASTVLGRRAERKTPLENLGVDGRTLLK
jgi:hypothetical protein